jgi:hypothetical protein
MSHLLFARRLAVPVCVSGLCLGGVLQSDAGRAAAQAPARPQANRPHRVTAEPVGHSLAIDDWQPGK